MTSVDKETTNVGEKVAHYLNSKTLNPTESLSYESKPSTSSQAAINETVSQIKDISIDAQKKDDQLLKPEAAKALIYAKVFPYPRCFGNKSIYAPSSMHMFDIISYMDELLVDNEYFF